MSFKLGSLIGLFLCIEAVAQTSVTNIGNTVNEKYVEQGIRVAVVRPALRSKWDDKYEINTPYEFNYSDSKAIDSTLGISIGYVKLPLHEIGWTTNLAYLSTSESSRSHEDLLRLDGNIAYSLIKEISIKAGINFIQLLGENAGYSVGLGYQGSLGFQISKYFGMDLGYVSMNTTANTSSYRKSINLSGIEASANITF